MKRRHLFGVCLSSSWKGIAIGAAVWLAVLISTAISSRVTHDPYVFGKWGTYDAATPFILMITGMFSTAGFSAGCCASNVSRLKSTNTLFLLGAPLSLIFAALDIIAVKTLLTPPEGSTAVRLFLEGQGLDYIPVLTLSDYMERLSFIYPLLCTAFGYYSFWMCGCMLTKWYLSGHKRTVIYQIISPMLIIPAALHADNIRSRNFQYILLLAIITLTFTSLPTIYIFLYFTIYQTTRPAADISDIPRISKVQFIITLVMFLITYLLTFECKTELYSDKGAPLPDMKENYDEK